jgi:carnitine O-acetyltransferase
MTNNTPRTFKTSAPARSSDLPAGYVEDPSAPAMLRFEASLPRLPVPTLSSTGAKYLETVQPHLTPLEFGRTQSIVQSFVQSELGKKLQERLQTRAADPDVKNWLAEWWNDVAYMAYRDPVVVYVSYFYVHVDDLWRRDQVKRAASLVKAVLPFRAMVES